MKRSRTLRAIRCTKANQSKQHPYPHFPQSQITPTGLRRQIPQLTPSPQSHSSLSPITLMTPSTKNLSQEPSLGQPTPSRRLDSRTRTRKIKEQFKDRCGGEKANLDGRI